MRSIFISILVMLGACTPEITPDDEPAPEATCSDGMQNGSETDVDCGGSCGACPTSKTCTASTDCGAAGICDAKTCRAARSCEEILRNHPGSSDGVYAIAPAGAAEPFQSVCDMTRDGGGWTLLLKTRGDATFAYAALAWTDDTVINPGDLTTQAGNAKYASFLSLPITTLRGELDGFRYTQAVGGRTARELFAGAPAIVSEHPTFNVGAPNWSRQPNCRTFGINIPHNFMRARFGWSANQEDDCLTNDTAIGLGLNSQRGAGYMCGSTMCSAGMVDAGGEGLLWGR